MVWSQEDNDFGLTLAKYGVSEGPYIVVRLLGPSTVLDALGGLVDGAMNPMNYVVSGALAYEAAAKPSLLSMRFQRTQRTWAHLMT
jgi:ABC-type transporter lipoprotein component MlaA